MNRDQTCSLTRSGWCWPPEHVVKITLYLQDLSYRRRFHKLWMEYFLKEPRIAIQVADASAQPGRNAHFAFDVIALDPNT